MKVLSSQVVEDILNNLSNAQLEQFQHAMSDALHEYESNPSIVPPRIVANGQQAESPPVHLFMPSIGSHVGVKTITGSKAGFKGATLIINPDDGSPIGLIDGAITTAFRTALCSTLPLVRTLPPGASAEKYIPRKMVVYGVGAQAYWHVKLALLIYGNSIHEVVVINRTLSKAQDLCELLHKQNPGVRFSALTLDSNDIESAYRGASIVFGCLPSTTPGILSRYVDAQQSQSGGKQLFISVIGSYKPHMTEVDGEVIRDIIGKGGKVVVDSIPHAGAEAGELIQNSVASDQLVQVYDFYNCDDIDDYKGSGNVVLCKLVGMSVMDVNIGAKLLQFAEDHGKGVDLDF